MTNDERCPIWGTPATISNPIGEFREIIVNSARAGAEYIIYQGVKGDFNRFDENQKAQLTTWLIDQRLLGNTIPKIFDDTIPKIVQRPLSVHERADRLLKYLEQNSPTVGRPVECKISEQTDPTLMEMLAYSVSLSVDEVIFLAEYLAHRGWINKSRNTMGKFMPIIMVDGYARLAELATKHVNSSQGFVAMWFDDLMNDAYENGIGPGIVDAGYKPLRIDNKEHANKIDDEIIAEIRRSRFLVADFTHGDDGARGGVYYEAGFAYGLNIPVFFTCHKNVKDKLHFDTRQFNHIFWETHAELRKALADRVSSIIGDGPDKTPK